MWRRASSPVATVWQPAKSDSSDCGRAQGAWMTKHNLPHGHTNFCRGQSSVSEPGSGGWVQVSRDLKDLGTRNFPGRQLQVNRLITLGLLGMRVGRFPF